MRFLNAAILCFLLPASLAFGQSPADDRAAAEEAFAKKLSGCALVGRFTMDRQPADKPAREERYDLISVSKIDGELWLFNARIKYGKHDVTVPLTLKVLWAGDTPVITLDDMTIPGLGSEFSARVLFHDHRYVGTWQHGKVGGHMFGRIEKLTDSAVKSNPK